mmetsp:Transcript_7356/g.15095  ORF Transcript_7356/g.15095 Transcript_7356/m.15095 type:complete len:113 (-) Transcript_7356:83-421(-)
MTTTMKHGIVTASPRAPLERQGGGGAVSAVAGVWAAARQRKVGVEAARASSAVTEAGAWRQISAAFRGVRSPGEKQGVEVGGGGAEGGAFASEPVVAGEPQPSPFQREARRV